MMKFNCEIKTENAAFTDNLNDEIARILNVIATKIRSGDTYGLAKDLNGNTVGTWDINETIDY